MSDTLSSDDVTPDPAERLHEALMDFLTCVGLAVPDICSYGLTIGESYVPFDPDPDDDCEDGEAACSQIWVRVTQVTPTEAPEGWAGSCAEEMMLGLEVGVIRCLEIPEDGEAPTATDVTTAALRAMSDMQAMKCAALNCEVWDSIEVGGWSPLGPLGGQVGGVLSFTVVI